jgi:FHS family L-fucose permease-like MFS transporter
MERFDVLIIGAGILGSAAAPTIFALGLKGLGPNTKLAGSLLVMAIVGGGAVPVGAGLHCKVDGEPGAGLHRSTCGFRCSVDLWVCRAVDSSPFREYRSRRLAEM